MFASRAIYEDLAAARTKAAVLEQQNTALQATLDWFRFRMTQLETERAILIQRYMGIEIPVPRAVPTETPASVGNAKVIEDILRSGGNLFADVGEREAARLGLAHDADGTIKD